jgi:hypothetical protein
VNTEGKKPRVEKGADMSRNASEKECHIAARDALKKIGAPQYVIDQEQHWIDGYS